MPFEFKVDEQVAKAAAHPDDPEILGTFMESVRKYLLDQPGFSGKRIKEIMGKKDFLPVLMKAMKLNDDVPAHGGSLNKDIATVINIMLKEGKVKVARALATNGMVSDVVRMLKYTEGMVPVLTLKSIMSLSNHGFNEHVIIAPDLVKYMKDLLDRGINQDPPDILKAIAAVIHVLSWNMRLSDKFAATLVQLLPKLLQHKDSEVFILAVRATTALVLMSNKIHDLVSKTGMIPYIAKGLIHPKVEDIEFRGSMIGAIGAFTIEQQRAYCFLKALKGTDYLNHYHLCLHPVYTCKDNFRFMAIQTLDSIKELIQNSTCSTACEHCLVSVAGSIMETGMLTSLVKIVGNKDYLKQLRETAAFIISYLGVKLPRDLVIMLPKAGAITPLVEFATQDDSPTQIIANTMGALSKMNNLPTPYQEQVVNDKVFKCFLRLAKVRLDKGEALLMDVILGTLYNLMHNRPPAPLEYFKDLPPFLKTLLDHEATKKSDRIQSCVMDCTYEFANYKEEGIDLVINAGLLPIVIKNLSNKNSDIRQGAANSIAVYCLGATRSQKQALVDFGIFNHIEYLMKRGEAYFRHVAQKYIRSLFEGMVEITESHKKFLRTKFLELVKNESKKYHPLTHNDAEVLIGVCSRMKEVAEKKAKNDKESEPIPMKKAKNDKDSEAIPVKTAKKDIIESEAVAEKKAKKNKQSRDVAEKKAKNNKESGTVAEKGTNDKESKTVVEMKAKNDEESGVVSEKKTKNGKESAAFAEKKTNKDIKESETVLEKNEESEAVAEKKAKNNKESETVVEMKAKNDEESEVVAEKKAKNGKESATVAEKKTNKDIKESETVLEKNKESEAVAEKKAKNNKESETVVERETKNDNEHEAIAEKKGKDNKESETVVEKTKNDEEPEAIAEKNDKESETVSEENAKNARKSEAVREKKVKDEKMAHLIFKKKGKDAKSIAIGGKRVKDAKASDTTAEKKKKKTKLADSITEMKVKAESLAGTIVGKEAKNEDVADAISEYKLKKKEVAKAIARKIVAEMVDAIVEKTANGAEVTNCVAGKEVKGEKVADAITEKKVEDKEVADAIVGHKERDEKVKDAVADEDMEMKDETITDSIGGTNVKDAKIADDVGCKKVKDDETVTDANGGKKVEDDEVADTIAEKKVEDEEVAESIGEKKRMDAKVTATIGEKKVEYAKLADAIPWKEVADVKSTKSDSIIMKSIDRKITEVVPVDESERNKLAEAIALMEGNDEFEKVAKAVAAELSTVKLHPGA